VGRVGERWKKEGAEINESLFKALEAEAEKDPVGTQEKWMDRVVELVTTAKCGNRLFYGVWGKKLVEDIQSTGTSNKGLASVRQAMTKVTIENVCKLRSTLRDIRLRGHFRL
jgi:hypothetical protein